MIKTEDGRCARLFIFDRGKVSTRTGPRHPCDAALIWKDSPSAVSVMLKRSPVAVFYAAAQGNVKIEGMNVYALWFNDAVNKAMG